jgi:hypothetical protein
VGFGEAAEEESGDEGVEQTGPDDKEEEALEGVGIDPSARQNCWRGFSRRGLGGLPLEERHGDAGQPRGGFPHGPEQGEEVGNAQDVGAQLQVDEFAEGGSDGLIDDEARIGKKIHHDKRGEVQRKKEKRYQQEGASQFADTEAVCDAAVDEHEQKHSGEDEGQVQGHPEAEHAKEGANGDVGVEPVDLVDEGGPRGRQGGPENGEDQQRPAHTEVLDPSDEPRGKRLTPEPSLRAA